MYNFCKHVKQTKNSFICTLESRTVRTRIHTKTNADNYSVSRSCCQPFIKIGQIEHKFSLSTLYLQTRIYDENDDNTNTTKRLQKCVVDTNSLSTNNKKLLGKSNTIYTFVQSNINISQQNYNGQIMPYQVQSHH